MVTKKRKTVDLTASNSTTANTSTEQVQAAKVVLENPQTNTQTTETITAQEEVKEEPTAEQPPVVVKKQEPQAGETVVGGGDEDTIESYTGEDSISGANQDTVIGATGEDSVGSVFVENSVAGASGQDSSMNRDEAGRGEITPVIAIDESPFQENNPDTPLAEPSTTSAVSTEEQPTATNEETIDMGTLSAATVVGDGTAAVGAANQTANTAGEAFVAAVYSAGENYWMNEYKILGYSETLTKTLLDILGIDSKATSVCKEQLKSVLYYAHHMGPHSCSDEATNKLNQTRFFNEFTLFLNVGCDDFRKAMSVSLAIVNESIKNGTGFSGVLPFRYMESLSGPPQLREGITAIMHLLTTTADPTKRALTVKQVDVPKCAAFGVSEVGKQRLMDFYSA